MGRTESCVYLLDGNEQSMIISGGTGYILPAVLQQMEAFAIDREKIGKLLILHAHFDHVGIVPYFKRTMPEIEVYASERAWEILRMPKAVDTINAFSRDIAKRRDMLEAYASHDLDWRDDISGSVVHHGDVLNLGRIAVHIFETPGHSSCAVSAYVPRLRALFPSDSGGIPYKDVITASGNSNYTKYQASLERLRDLEVDYYCADHYGYITGKEANDFIQRTIGVAQAHRREMENALRKTGNIEAAAKALVRTALEENPDYFLSPEIFEGVYRQMVKHIANAMDMADTPDA